MLSTHFNHMFIANKLLLSAFILFWRSLRYNCNGLSTNLNLSLNNNINNNIMSYNVNKIYWYV